MTRFATQRWATGTRLLTMPIQSRGTLTDANDLRRSGPTMAGQDLKPITDQDRVREPKVSMLLAICLIWARE